MGDPHFAIGGIDITGDTTGLVGIAIRPEVPDPVGFEVGITLEVVNDEGEPVGEGETGHIVITDLHNYGMPFIRYRIGDLGVFTNRSCSCDRGLPLLEDITGRSLDVIRTPSGKILPGEFFPHLMKDFPEIQKFQVIQKKIDQIDIKVICPNGLSGDRC